MVKSSKWCLNRINYDGTEEKVFRLNEGDTTIGRNKAADITSTSTICSRNQCVISLISDKVTLSNKSSNGTYVNDEMIGEMNVVALNHHDFIGLGCSYSIFTHVEKEEWSTFSVYQLVDKTKLNVIDSTATADRSDVIDLVSDDEDIEPITSLKINEDKMAAPKKPKNKNKNKKDKPTNTAKSTSNNNNKEPNIESTFRYENAATSPQSNNDQENDDNEMIYSQQVLMEVKQEVNFPDDNFAHADDFSILIESDESSDNELGNWSEKLSQDQDFVVKKVTESAQNNKRKCTKQIEAFPLLPAKRQRRNSMPANAQRKPIVNSDQKKQRAHDDSSSILNKPSTSKQPAPKKNDGKPFIDPLDPFARHGKKQSTFTDALKRIDIVSKKKRIAHVPKSHPHLNVPKDLTSVLRQENGCWPSEDKSGKIVRRVRFTSEPPQVHEFIPEYYDDDMSEIIIPSPVKQRPSEITGMSCFENDPLHSIITDITEWKTEWLPQRNVTPPINGVNFVISPMTVKYTSFEAYKENVIPLLKHELWSSIQAENRNRNSFEAKITTMNTAKRADRNRRVFHVQVTNDGTNAKANVGDFVIVEADASRRFFAYVTEQKFTRSGYSRTTNLSMEASDAVVKLKNGESSTLRITPIANIRTELKLFNAVLYLDRTTFKDLILNPDLYTEQSIPNQIKNFNYSGYDKLNRDQMSILKSIYNKCLSSVPNLSLIEGPPGTGKTRLIVSIILQLLFGKDMKRKLRILVLTSSNAAVDIIARKLIHVREKLDKSEKKKFLNIVRFGVLGSMHPDVRKIAPENLKNEQPLPAAAQSEKVRNLQANKKTHEQWIEKLKNEPNINTTVVQDKIKEHQKDIAMINESISKMTNLSHSELDGIADVMANARVVCSTLSSSINLKQYVKRFDVCLIDEASQCTEPWSLVPLQYQISSLILVGDSNQLSPVVLSTVCRENRMGVSLFARMYDNISRKGAQEQSTYTMTTQYRMHPEICAFSNGYFYKNRLTSAPSTREGFFLNPYSVFNLPCLQSNQDMVSFYNVDEAKFIVTMLKVMIKHANPKEFSYGIITPYAKQRLEIQRLLCLSQTLVQCDIPVNTIDSYQGQEKDIIILCTTRTTGVGFLSNPQRLNVALTRAKKCLIVCGNFKSISNSSAWKHLLNDAGRREILYDIPPDYSFQTIARSLVNKGFKPKTKK